ncbi:hypothetical protein NIES267_17390 [Calothrix parasitica NIES-267]|uniref:DUF4114 domain-containing protein n=1 Tax=Calothrix parasitica NIES-267 TaxID=1973488 RepID=A0A1Z4LM01_9CYAN|nr:hypothetical protein NIES267_17390 [Calothrix parasitica NIES-267]
MDTTLQKSVQNNAIPQSPTNNLDVSAATYLGGAEDDFTNAVGISADGKFVVVGGSLINANLGVTETELLGGGDGTVIRYDSETNQVVSSTRLPGKIVDLEVSKNGDIAVAYEGGIAVLNSDATQVKWSQSLSDVFRIAISDSGKVAAIEDTNADKAYLFDSNGQELQQWTTSSDSNHFYDIAVTDQEGGMVIATGYKQKTSDLQVAFTQAWSHTGQNLWKNYDFSATDIQSENVMADTRGVRVAIGRDGKLYASYKINGGTGSSILASDPNDLSEKLGNDRKIETDNYNRPTNVGSISMVWYGRYDPKTGELIKGQSLLSRLNSGKGNSVEVESITATEDGTVILAGSTGARIANRDSQTIEGETVSEYTGFEGYIAIVSPDLEQRISWTPITDGKGAVAASRNGKTAVVTTTDFAGEQITHNAVQNTAGGKNDGYLLVIGGNDAPPGTEPPTDVDNPIQPGGTGSENPTQPGGTGGNNPTQPNGTGGNNPTQPGGTGGENPTQPAGLIDLTNIDLNGDNQVDKKVNINFLDVKSDAAFNNSVGYYAISNINGAIKDALTGELINPEDEGYAKAALQQRVENLQIRRNNKTPASELNSGVMLVPFLVANGTAEEWIEQNSDNQEGNLPIAYFSFLNANPDNKQHIRQVGNELQFEDLFNGGDNDFNDFVVKTNIDSAV